MGYYSFMFVYKFHFVILMKNVKYVCLTDEFLYLAVNFLESSLIKKTPLTVENQWKIHIHTHTLQEKLQCVWLYKNPTLFLCRYTTKVYRYIRRKKTNYIIGCILKLQFLGCIPLLFFWNSHGRDTEDFQLYFIINSKIISYLLE